MPTRTVSRTCNVVRTAGGSPPRRGRGPAGSQWRGIRSNASAATSAASTARASNRSAGHAWTSVSPETGRASRSDAVAHPHTGETCTWSSPSRTRMRVNCAIRSCKRLRSCHSAAPRNRSTSLPCPSTAIRSGPASSVTATCATAASAAPTPRRPNRASICGPSTSSSTATTGAVRGELGRPSAARTAARQSSISDSGIFVAGLRSGTGNGRADGGTTGGAGDGAGGAPSRTRGLGTGGSLGR